MTRITVSTPIDNMKLVTSWVNSIRKVKIFVGVTEEHDDREDGRIGNVALANILENGAPGSNIPPRPFMRPGMAAVKDDGRESLKRAADALYTGNQSKAKSALNGYGKKAVASIRRVMESNVPPPLKKDTLRKRRSHGKRSKKTLMDTGQLWKSISYKIEGV
jgi:hypothetical protein